MKKQTKALIYSGIITIIGILVVLSLPNQFHRGYSLIGCCILITLCIFEQMFITITVDRKEKK